MKQLLYTLAVAPFFAFGLVLYVRFVHGVTGYSQEWMDAAAIGCVYTILISFIAIILVRLVMFFQEQGVRQFRH